MGSPTPNYLLLFDLFPEPDAQKHEVGQYHEPRDKTNRPRASHHGSVSITHHNSSMIPYYCMRRFVIVFIAVAAASAIGLIATVPRIALYSPALLLAGTQSKYTLPSLYQEQKRPIRVLIVPGHDEESVGAVYRGLRETDLTVTLGEELVALFARDTHFAPMITRTNNGYTDTFAALFENNRESVKSFQDYVKYYAQLFLWHKMIIPRKTVDHATARPEQALKLYGINWWVNGNSVDLALHIHFNDYPRRDRNKPGEYYGYAIYYPERQLPNHYASKPIAQALHRRLRNILMPSTYPQESGGLVESQELIALGANGSLDSAALLIEYSYIYEPWLQDAETRERMIKKLALETYQGIVEYLATANQKN